MLIEVFTWQQGLGDSPLHLYTTPYSEQQKAEKREPASTQELAGSGFLCFGLAALLS